MIEEVIRAVGHPAVAATHASTLELTTDDWLTPAGDCIIGIEADRSPAGLSDELVEACRSTDTTVTLRLEVAGLEERIVGRGDPGLTCSDDRSMVARTSEYVDDRTVMLAADKAAADLDRALIAPLQRGDSLTATLSVHPG